MPFQVVKMYVGQGCPVFQGVWVTENNNKAMNTLGWEYKFDLIYYYAMG